MSMDMISYSLAKKYVEDTANALGAVKGAPCTIKSIEKTDVGATIIFEWQGSDGNIQTSSLHLKDGGYYTPSVSQHTSTTVEVTFDPSKEGMPFVKPVTITLPICADSSQNVDFKTDETLTLEGGVLSVNTTDLMEQDNTLPITSAGVYATVGNIEALLKTI